MAARLRPRIGQPLNRGQSSYRLTAANAADQVKASKPTLDYDLHYGSETGLVTTAGFVEAVYKDLSKPQGKPIVR